MKIMMLLVFTAGRDRYGIDVSEIVEVIPLVTTKATPHSPDYVAGLINYRGRVAPVIDMGALIAGSPSRELLSTRIVIVDCAEPDVDNSLLGLLVEQATEIVRCDERQFQSAGVKSEEAGYLGSVLPDNKGIVQRISVKQILPDSVRRSLFPPVEAR